MVDILCAVENFANELSMANNGRVLEKISNRESVRVEMEVGLISMEELHQKK